ncbi:hypothetical protein L596_022817 [Steinernema carpocapsae]|uniref:Uncharacterized protein n=1 Tax=Steinernema carpocapsae TaxID=34508 RepID=A0A4V6A0B7_STECR|nr:hypothetical protein L596_022817 [Steinernema carpocapsae]
MWNKINAFYRRRNKTAQYRKEKKENFTISSVFLTLLPCTIAVGYDGIGFAIFRRSKLSFFFAIVKFLVGL